MSVLGVLGTVFVTAIAARILILQKAPKVEASEIENLLRGDILFVTPELFFLTFAAFVLVLGVHFLFFLVGELHRVWHLAQFH